MKASKTKGCRRSGAVTAAIATTLIMTATAQDVTSGSDGIFYPEPIERPTFTPHSAQKAVGISTDIISVGMPLATLAGVCIAGDWEGLRQGCYTAAATAAATLLLKYTVSEERPNYKNNHSFPSGHTSASFATAAFLQRRYGWKFGAPAYAVATYVAWGRVYSRNHHWWDVVAGAAIGVGSGYIFTRPWAKKHDLQVGVWSTGESRGLNASFIF